MNIAGTQLAERNSSKEREIVECLPLNVIVGELLARNDDGEEDEQADGVLVIQPVGEIVVASHAEVADRRDAMKRIEDIHGSPTVMIYLRSLRSHTHTLINSRIVVVVESPSWHRAPSD